MPPAIDDVYHADGASLLPRDRADLVTACSCPDSGDPCKHVAATHYVLGEALDTDPFLLFELRGRTKEQVLAALSQLRSAEPGLPAPKAVVQGSSVALEELSVNQFEQGVTAVPALHFDFDSTVAA